MSMRPPMVGRFSSSSFTNIGSASSWFEVYASFSTFMMLLRTAINDLIPLKLRNFIISKLTRFFTDYQPNNQVSLQIDQFWDGSTNHLYYAAKEYIPTKISNTYKSLKVGKISKHNNMVLAFDGKQVVEDEFDDIKLKWRLVENSNNGDGFDNPKKEYKEYKHRSKDYDENGFVLSFDEKHRDKVMEKYIPHVLSTYEAIKAGNKTLKIHSMQSGPWKQSDLTHPASFDSLAMDPDLKNSIIDDLDRFLRRKKLYKKVGKPWKRGYLLYGPPGTGKSSLIAAMAKENWIDMLNEFQKDALSTRLGIPIFYGIDAVHGNSPVYKATIFPHNIGLGATRDPELVKRIGAATALEVRATGMQYVYAPCIAVCRDPRWGRCYESYSEDPKVVQAMTEIIPGMQGDVPDNMPMGVPFIAGNEKVIACAKHYVGDGGTTNGIDESDTVIDRDGLMEIHMPGYLSSISKGVATIMVSYSSWNGDKMHAHHDLITGFLKNTLHFQGFVISDFEGIDRITSPFRANCTYSVQAGVSAGIDMFMVPKFYTEFIDDLTTLVNNKFIPMSRIDDAVRRILRVKFMMGIFENPFADYSLVKYLGIKEHKELAREAVRKSMVLLKNGKSAEKPLLPLPKKVPKILVAGSHANNLGYQCGGWTIEWQGVNGNDDIKGTTILNAVKNTVDPETTVIYKENPDKEFLESNEFCYAIVVVGEHPYAEMHGDNMNLTIPNPGPEIITNVCGAMKCVVIIISGRPLVIEPYVGLIDAVVAGWLPGSEGQGVADVLFGDYGFTGKLPRTWFKSVDQLPMNVGDPHYDPVFPFGFGLTTKPTKPIYSE